MTITAMAVVATTVVAGCSSSPSSTGSSSASDTTEASVSPSESSASAPSGEEVSLSAWTFKKEWVPGLEAVADAYAKATGKNFKLDVQYFNEENGIYASKVSAAGRGDSLPDLLTSYGSQWDYVGGGLFEQLNGKLDTALTNIPTTLVDTFVKMNQANADACKANPDCTYGDVQIGDYYTVPQISGGTGFFFVNKSKLAEAGLDPNAAPADWSALIADMQKTAAADAATGGFIMPLKIPETGWLWLLRPMLFTQLGAEKTEALFADPTGALWEDPAVVHTLQLYDELSPYWTSNALQSDIIGADDTFAAGQATWYYGGTFSLAGLVQRGLNPDDMLIFPMPAATGGALDRLTLQPWASGQIGISSDSQKSEEAQAFLEFYMSQPAAEVFQAAVHDTPAVTLPPGPDSGANPMQAATSETFGEGSDAFNEFTVYGPQCDGAKTLNNQAAVALTQLIGDGTTPEELAATLHDLYHKAWASCG